MIPDRLQEVLGPQHVRLQRLAAPLPGVPHIGHSRQVEDPVGPCLPDQGGHSLGLPQVQPAEVVRAGQPG